MFLPRREGAHSRLRTGVVGCSVMSWGRCVRPLGRHESWTLHKESHDLSLHTNREKSTMATISAILKYFLGIYREKNIISVWALKILSMLIFMPTAWHLFWVMGLCVAIVCKRRQHLKIYNLVFYFYFKFCKFLAVLATPTIHVQFIGCANTYCECHWKGGTVQWQGVPSYLLCYHPWWQHHAGFVESLGPGWPPSQRWSMALWPQALSPLMMKYTNCK